MISDYERNAQENKQQRALWVIGVGLLMVLSYQMGISRGRSEKTLDRYGEVSAQYQRLEREYADMRDRCEKTSTEYSALKAQYDRIEAAGMGAATKAGPSKN